MGRAERPLSGESPGERGGRPRAGGRQHSARSRSRPEAERANQRGKPAGAREREGERDRPTLNEVTFLTVSEVASVMRVSKMTVYRLVHSGELPAVRVGRSFRVPEQAVHEYLQDSYFEVS